MNNMSCWSLKYTQSKWRLLILLLSPLPKSTFVHVSRHNFFVISSSRNKCKISVIHASRHKKRQIHVHVKKLIHVSWCKKETNPRSWHEKKASSRFTSSTFTTWKKKANSRFKSYLAGKRGGRGRVINVRNQFLFRFNVGKSYSSNRCI